MMRDLVPAVLLITLAFPASGAQVSGSGRIELSSSYISPNGDGLRDKLVVTATAPEDTTLDLRVYNSAGKLIITLVEDYVLSYGKGQFVWDGVGTTAPVPAGKYILSAAFRGKETTTSKATVVVEKLPKLPAISYSAKPFFPIGVWFEGNPTWGGYPNTAAGAKAYYDRAFADLSAHNFNTVVVPNCPEHLWETLLQSAQKHRIKVVLEVGPLVALVSGQPLKESQTRQAVTRVVNRIGKYDSLLRYQIRDEPSPSVVANWLVVQRVLAAADPSRPAFSCFCSRDALASVVGQTKLSEAVFDIYPLGTGTPAQSLGNFISALDAFNEAASGSTPWVVLQSFAKPNAWRYPTPEELRAMTYLSLAAGAKGVFYFIYQTMPNHPEKLEGLVDEKGNPTPIYSAASDLARELANLSKLLLSLKPTNYSPSAPADALARSFTDKTGKPVIIVASKRPDAQVSVNLTGCADGRWYDAITNETFESTGGAMEVLLGPGAGRVLVKKG